ncbi:MAG: hypothetical protein ACR2N7_09660 [Acidimicrobiia bacterium]
MARRRKTGAFLVLGATTLLLVTALASPASAIVTDGCSGSAKFSNDTEVNAAQSLSIVSVIPEKDDNVRYTGMIDVPPPDEPVPFVGGIVARVAGFVPVTVASWSDTTEENSRSGVYSYEAPEWVPRGTGEILVEASHTQQGKTCMASVKMTLEGDPGAAAIAAAAGTAVAGAGVLGAGIKKKGVK